MEYLIPVQHESDILPPYRDTPIEELLAYHNLGAPFACCEFPDLLIGMCMDHRERVRIPENFAYILRIGGANLRYSEFQVSYAIAVGGVKAIALLGHTNCGMVNLMSRREQFVSGLVEKAGWQREWAESHFMHYALMFEIGQEVDFLVSEAKRLRARYPKILVVPLLFRIEDHQVYQIEESAFDCPEVHMS